jgi:hypothetical protein
MLDSPAHYVKKCSTVEKRDGRITDAPVSIYTRDLRKGAKKGREKKVLDA